MRAAKVFLASELLTLSLVAIPSASAGGIEHYCFNGQERIEFWPAGRFPITWEIWSHDPSGNGSHSIVPGFPPFTCFDGPPSMSWVQRPGLQSLILGAQAWGKAAMPHLQTAIGSPQPPPPVKATSFSMSSTPVLRIYTSSNTCPPVGVGGIGADTTNSFIFLQSLSCSDGGNPPMALGGLSPMTIALTAVSRNNATGEILDADVFFNAARASSNGPRYYGWLERNQSLGEVFVSEIAPTMSFVDLQGVVTHEVGHLAGLAHSLIDSTASPQGSLFPTMWLFGGTNGPFSGVVTGPDSMQTNCPPNWGLSQSVSGMITADSTRTLEPDDISAIGAAYPSTPFRTELGRITGTVSRLLGQTSLPVSGAVVVAIHKDDPDRHRIATFSYGQGLYALEGLPPGKYYVFVEAVDTGSPGYFGAWPGNSMFPEYVWGGNSSCVSQSDMSWVDFGLEFYSIPETFSGEPDGRQGGEEVKVKPGTTTGSIDFKVGGSLLPYLSVASSLSGPSSLRGLVLTAGATTAVFHAVGPINKAVELWIGTDRVLELQNNQLRQIPLSGPGYLATRVGQTDINGVCTWTVDLAGLFSSPDSVADRNIFAQVGLCQDLTGCPDSHDAYSLSNPVNVWVAR